jgi:hypothetical protein
MELRGAIFKALKREDLQAALCQVNSIVRPPEDVYYQELADSYSRVRRFLPTLLRTFQFGCTPAGQPVVDALNYLSKVEENGRSQAADPPIQIVTRGWRDLRQKSLCVLLPGSGAVSAAPSRSLHCAECPIRRCPAWAAE